MMTLRMSSPTLSYTIKMYLKSLKEDKMRKEQDNNREKRRRGADRRNDRDNKKYKTKYLVKSKSRGRRKKQGDRWSNSVLTSTDLPRLTIISIITKISSKTSIRDMFNNSNKT
jgi:hypothetical protein